MDSVQKTKILCFGDSLTAGLCRRTPNSPYGNTLRSLMQNYLPDREIDLVIYGASGRLASTLVNQIEQHLEYGYDWVVILVGTNDLGFNKRQEDILGNIIKTHLIAHEAGARTIACSIPETKRKEDIVKCEKRNWINCGLKKWCDSVENSIWCDVFNLLPYHRLSEEDRRKYWAHDGLHFTQEGYAKLGTIIFECFRNHLEADYQESHTTWTIHTHNILAQTWVDWSQDLGLGWYGKEVLQSGFLDSEGRLCTVFKKAEEAQPDVICFQEVGETELRALKSHKLSEEFEIFWVPNAVTCGKEANGVATLAHKDNVEVVKHEELQFGDETGASLLSCRKNGSSLLIFNVHLDGPQCIHEAEKFIERFDTAVWCGDFNSKPRSVEHLQNNGYNDCFEFVDKATYLSPKGSVPERLDYILHRGDITLEETNSDIGPTDFLAMLQSEGSDHVSLTATFKAPLHSM